MCNENYCLWIRFAQWVIFKKRLELFGFFYSCNWVGVTLYYVHVNAYANDLNLSSFLV